MLEHSLFVSLLGLILGATALVALCHRFGLTSIVGYLAAGLLLGPYALGLLQESSNIELLAEIGVVLLMFTIGLEFSLPRLLASKRLVLGLGGAQMAVGMLVFAGGFYWAGLSWSMAIVLGGAFTMSSTAIELKQLAEQGELEQPHGRIAVGVLLFQDLAAVAFLVLTPMLTGGSGTVADFWRVLLQAIAVFVVLALSGRFLLPRILHWVAETHSLELFMLAVLAMALSAAGLSLLAGLSATLGAFMAGMMLGETHFRHQIEADIRPFRDLMLGIFFISIGMQLDPAVLRHEPGLIALVVVGAMVIKGALTAAVFRMLGTPAHTALRAAIVLAQGGEFGLLLVAQIITFGTEESRYLQPVLAGLIISMLLATVLLRFNEVMAGKLLGKQASGRGRVEPVNQADEFEDFVDHVIICGYDRLGQGVARILAENNLATLGIDRDPHRVLELREKGETVLFGDAANPTLLQLARIDKARAVAVTIDDPVVADGILAQIKRLNPDMPVVLHCAEVCTGREMRERSVYLFDSLMESSLMFARQLLVVCGVTSEETARVVDQVRAHDYEEFREE